jgi:hypothetical protein
VKCASTDSIIILPAVVAAAVVEATDVGTNQLKQNERMKCSSTDSIIF